MNQLIAKFRQLNEREQRLVIFTGAFVFIAVIYLAIYAPLNDSIEKNQNSINSQTELLTWVSQNANKVIQMRQSGSKGSSFNGSLPQAVNQTAGRYNIAITRMQPQGDEIQVWVDSAVFNDTMSWLQAIENMGIKILEADITEGDSAGIIKIRRLKLSKL